MQDDPKLPPGLEQRWTIRWLQKLRVEKVQKLEFGSIYFVISECRRIAVGLDQSMVLRDLGEGEVADGVGGGLPLTIPRNEPLQGSFET